MLAMVFGVAAAAAVVSLTGAESTKGYAARCVHASRSTITEHLARREKCIANEILAELPLPEGAVQVSSPSRLGRFGDQLVPARVGVPCSPEVAQDDYWRVPGTAREVIRWIQDHPLTGAHRTGSGEGGGGDGREPEWDGYLSVAVKKPGVVQREELLFAAIEAKGGTALRGEAVVVPAHAACHEYDY